MQREPRHPMSISCNWAFDVQCLLNKLFALGPSLFIATKPAGSASRAIADFKQLFHHAMQVTAPFPRAESIVQLAIETIKFAVNRVVAGIGLEDLRFQPGQCLRVRSSGFSRF